MATINKAVLQDAHRDGMLKAQASISYLHSSVNTCNCILAALQKAGKSGLDVGQLVHRVDIASESVKIFTRELVDLGLIRIEISGPGGKNIYFLEDY